MTSGKNLPQLCLGVYICPFYLEQNSFKISTVLQACHDAFLAILFVPLRFRIAERRFRKAVQNLRMSNVFRLTRCIRTADSSRVPKVWSTANANSFLPSLASFQVKLAADSLYAPRRKPKTKADIRSSLYYPHFCFFQYRKM